MAARLQLVVAVGAALSSSVLAQLQLSVGGGTPLSDGTQCYTQAEIMNQASCQFRASWSYTDATSSTRYDLALTHGDEQTWPTSTLGSDWVSSSSSARTLCFNFYSSSRFNTAFPSAGSGYELALTINGDASVPASTFTFSVQPTNPSVTAPSATTTFFGGDALSVAWGTGTCA